MTDYAIVVNGQWVHQFRPLIDLNQKQLQSVVNQFCEERNLSTQGVKALKVLTKDDFKINQGK